MNMHEILRQDPEIWDLFSCQEIYRMPLKDCFDRVLYYTSRNRDIFKPKASQYLADHGYSIDYPHNANFAVCLTHDIDVVYSSIFSKCLAAYREIKRKNATAAGRLLSQVRSKRIPHWNFSEIMDLEEKYGAKSTFFFMVERMGEQDYSYEIEALDSEIEKIIDRGWEVGLHGGHTTYLDPVEMRFKKTQLERITRKPVLGYRNHFLRFKVPDTWEHLGNAGFKYDSTFGYPDCAGFRNGMCHPFRPINLNTGREIDILEVPLIIMDRTLTRYMCLDGERKWDITKNLIDATERCHGVITILWHNTQMSGEWLGLYEKILRYCEEKGAWISSGEEIIKRSIVEKM
jgi:peptidoglycan/xylan/chitin deacetylase (PgdA/CDA1 family)